MFTTLSIVLSIGRYYIRYQIIRGLDLADLFHGIALIILILVTISSTFVSSSLGQRLVDNKEHAYLQFRETNSCLWLVGLYSVKLSSLLFYGSIFRVLKTFTRAWGLITAFTFVTFTTSLGATIVQASQNARNLSGSGERFPKSSNLTLTLNFRRVIKND